MKTTLLLLSLLFTLAACQPYPEQTLKDIDGDGKPDEACPQFKYVSNISIQVNANSDLPAKLSGGVNSKLAIDECAFGNNASDYSIVRNGQRSVTIAVWVDNNARLSRELFDQQGKPLDNTFMHLKLTGKTNCNDREVTVTEIHRVLNWQPVYASGKNCGVSGYTAIIQ